jgi:hypothetical protein
MKHHVYIFFSWSALVQKVHLVWNSIGALCTREESGELRERIESEYHIPPFILLTPPHFNGLFMHCMFSLTHPDVNDTAISSRMTSRKYSVSASLALHANGLVRQLLRRSEAHIHHALQRSINGLTTRMGELLTTAQAQLERTSEAHLTSLTVA